ncbi:UNVERIFIED_CONTAM: hypothetical protein Sradi_1254400 [Sesamum radiatum]|uniref:FHA domain-containing protein n=1 Tax=Sesamum radiatum TaxID=300843 RepID=A0AAW2UN36_SESRA
MTTHSLSYAKTNSFSPGFFPAKSSVAAQFSVNFLGYNCLPRKLKCSGRQLRNFGAVRASDSGSSSADGSVRWLLEPIGQLDQDLIMCKMENVDGMEEARKILGSMSTMILALKVFYLECRNVGRVPEKADIVISVPTVSALHARIQKTDENLLITDLDSTNGTFIDEKWLQPGVVSAASPGNLVTFGDTNLAIFRVYKLKQEEVASELEESGAKSEDVPSENLESTS